MDCCFGSGLRYRSIRSRNSVAKFSGCVRSSSMGVLGYCKYHSYSHASLFGEMEFWHTPSWSCICVIRGSGGGGGFGWSVCYCVNDNIFVWVAFNCHFF